MRRRHFATRPGYARTKELAVATRPCEKTLDPPHSLRRIRRVALILLLASPVELGCSTTLERERRGPGFYRCVPAEESVGPVVEYHTDTLQVVAARREVFVTVFALNLDREVTLSQRVARWYHCERLDSDPQEAEITEPQPL